MKPLLAIVCGALLCLTCQLGCRPEPATQKKSAAHETLSQGVDVRLAPVVQADFVDRVEVPITIDGYEKAELMSRIEGYVGEISVNIGDKVEQGQVLARLDMPEMIAEHRRQEKLVEQAHADFLSQQSEVSRAEAQMAEQQALKQLRESELKRTRKLFESGAFKKDRLEEAQYSVEAVLASLERIEADVRAAETQMRSAQAAVEVAQAELEKSHAMMSYMDIKAPFAGVITTRMVDPGALVRPPSGGTGAGLLFTIESVDRLRGIVMLPIEDVAHLQAGASVELDSIRGVPSEALQRLHGVESESLVVTRRAGAFQRGSRMMRAEIDILNPIDPETGQRLLKPGDYGKVVIALRQFSQIPSVPATAVGTDSLGSFVMKVAKDRTCHRISVNVLVTHQEQAALQIDTKDASESSIDPTLRSGDPVVSQGLEKIRDGDRLP